MSSGHSSDTDTEVVVDDGDALGFNDMDDETPVKRKHLVKLLTKVKGMAASVTGYHTEMGLLSDRLTKVEDKLNRKKSSAATLNIQEELPDAPGTSAGSADRSNKKRKVSQKEKDKDESGAKLEVAKVAKKSELPFTRSRNCTSGKRSQNDLLTQALLQHCEDGLKVVDCGTKGRGVVATKSFAKGDFLVEYRGELLDVKTTKQREAQYEKDRTGCYVYYFEFEGKRSCIDATEETRYLGRLVNHSRKHPNAVIKLINFESKPRLILIALKDISVGEELLYDYGERSASTIAANPWLDLNTKFDEDMDGSGEASDESTTDARPGKGSNDAGADESDINVEESDADNEAEMMSKIPLPDMTTCLLHSIEGRIITPNKNGKGLFLRYEIPQDKEYRFTKAKMDPLLEMAYDEVKVDDFDDAVKKKLAWKVLAAFVESIIKQEYKDYQPPILLMSEVITKDKMEWANMSAIEIMNMQPMPISVALENSTTLLNVGVTYGERTLKRMVLDCLPTVAKFVKQLRGGTPKVSSPMKQ